VDTTCRKILDRTQRRQVDPEMLRRVDAIGISFVYLEGDEAATDPPSPTPRIRQTL
jgi:hypothetical protein